MGSVLNAHDDGEQPTLCWGLVVYMGRCKQSPATVAPQACQRPNGCCRAAYPVTAACILRIKVISARLYRCLSHFQPNARGARCWAAAHLNQSD
jgi:hypothetical protein